MKKIILLLIALSIVSASWAQKKTIGLRKADLTKASNGYTLLYPSDQSTVYLLNNCGQIVHSWTDGADFRPGNSVFLLENGVLLKTKRASSVAGDPINGPGAGGTVEKRDWDNNLLWTFTLNDSFSRLHHDICPMPNGNVLMISWDKKTKAELISQGRNPSTWTSSVIWPEKIIEVKPVGKDGYTIVWEWREWDHLVQEFDSTKPNYGKLIDHPERVDINFGSTGAQSGSAWTFFNSIDYNENLDQIVLSTRFFNEIWIIDHSTTTQQAAGKTGGKSNKGGDLLFRWGNPKVYNAGVTADQKLYSQHTARWMTDNPADSNFGKIILFNNLAGPNYSTIDIVKPVFDKTTSSYVKDGKTFLPKTMDWTYKRSDNTEMYSTGFGSAQRLPNGNTLICSGRQGNTFEITPKNEIVWEYIVPLNFGVRATQGDSIPVPNNSVFRAERFAPNYPAFTGKNLSPKGYIELNPDTSFCSLPVGISKIKKSETIKIYPNPAHTTLNIETKSGLIHSVALMSITGQTIMEIKNANSGFASLDISEIPAGIYFLSLNNNTFTQKLEIKH